MSGKRWTVDHGHLSWDGVIGRPHLLTREQDAALVQAVTDAARLRSLVARMDSHLNRGRSFTGAEVAAMLRDGGPADDSDIMPGSEFDGPVVL